MSTNSFHFVHFGQYDAQFEIPMNLNSLLAFREWITSDDAPEQGRFDYINGHIEVDMSPEDLYTHGSLKLRIAGILDGIVHERKLGHVFVDSTRVSCPAANLSVEPDVGFVSKASLSAGRVRRISKASHTDRYVEYEGPPDLIVEVVSDSSVKKDIRQFPKSYFEAGVYEYWLVDARGEKLRFQLNRRGASAYEETPLDAEGYQFSTVLQHRFKLVRERDEDGIWDYDLLAEPV